MQAAQAITAELEQVSISEPVRPHLLEKYSAIIRAADSELLRWYYRSGGLEMFSGSPLANILERANMFRYTAAPCLTCGGDEGAWFGGCGFVNTKGKRPLDDAQRERLAKAEAALDADGLLPAAGDMVCRECDGRGWRLPKKFTHSREPITARPTGSSKNGGCGSAADVNETDMEKLGKVTTYLARVRGIQGNIPVVQALDAFFSPDGGNLNALWALVPAGKTMLRSNPQKLPPTQLFQNLRVQQAEKPTDKRRAQFAAADEQSEALLGAMGMIWNQAVES